MRQGLRRWLAGCLLCMVMMGCSSKEMMPLTEYSATSKDNTLVVMRIHWTEKYNDVETKESRTITGASLLTDEKAIAKTRVERDKTALYRVLYYLHTFRFEFETKDGAPQVFTRFGKNLHQYEPLALYQFKPGSLSLENISWVKLVYNPGNRKIKEERWYKKAVELPEAYGSWNLPKGKVVYLGDLSMVFRTQRFMHGILSPEELNKKIELERVEIADNYEEAVAELKEKKPWFPADQMVNLSKPNRWVYIEDEQKVTEEKPKAKSENSFY